MGGLKNKIASGLNSGRKQFRWHTVQIYFFIVLIGLNSFLYQ